LASLLEPARAVVPFIGREEELTLLLAWCLDAEASPVRLVVGAGGVGKSRLADRLIARLSETGWLCSRVGEALETQAWQRTTDGQNRPVLLVVDYAETRTELAALLRSAAAEPERARVLLLARGVGEWWDELAASDAPVRNVVENAGPIALSTELDAGLSQAELIADAVPYFASVLGVPPVTSQTIAVRASSAGPVPVLVLHAAALLTVLESARSQTQAARDPRALTVDEVLKALLGHEARFWRGSRPASLASVGMAGCRAAVALACLVAPRELPGAEQLLSRVPELADVPIGVRRDTARWLRSLYPPSGAHWWGSLAPDLLAEHLVCEVLGESPDLPGALLGGLDPLSAVGALTVITRAAAHHTEAPKLLERALRDDTTGLIVPGIVAAVRGGGVLGSVLERVCADAPVSGDELLRIEQAIPYPTTALAEMNVTVVKRIVAQLPGEAADSERAHWNMALATALSQAGRPADALLPAQNTVDAYRILVDSTPDRFLIELARALNNQGVWFSQSGRTVDALPPTQEAVNTYRRLAEDESGGHDEGLALALTNLAVRYKELGCPVDALPPAEEAVGIFRRLTEVDPDLHLGALAASVNNFGVMFQQLKDLAAALPYAQEAVDTRRRLAEGNPDRYLGDLATSLNNLSVVLHELGRPADEVLPPAREAVDLYRRLARANPGRYRGELAQSLDNLRSRSATLGSPDDAVAHGEEAVEVYRQLTAAEPGRYSRDLGHSLCQLGIVFALNERPADGIKLTKEAVQLHRQLAQNDPLRYAGDLAESLSCLGRLFAAAGSRAEALAPTQEAAEIYEQLAEDEPGRYLDEQADSLDILSTLLLDQGLTADALLRTEEAVNVRRRLAEAEPERHSDMLGQSLDKLGILLMSRQRFTDALLRTEEAVEFHQRLSQAEPGLHRDRVAGSLVNLGIVLAAQGNPADALVPAREAVDIYRQLIAAGAPEHGGQLARALTALGMHLHNLGQDGEAAAAFEESARLQN
jgi:tetratricopeptide (TPR) repeat protein